MPNPTLNAAQNAALLDLESNSLRSAKEVAIRVELATEERAPWTIAREKRLVGKARRALEKLVELGYAEKHTFGRRSRYAATLEGRRRIEADRRARVEAKLAAEAHVEDCVCGDCVEAINALQAEADAEPLLPAAPAVDAALLASADPRDLLAAMREEAGLEALPGTREERIASIADIELEEEAPAHGPKHAPRTLVLVACGKTKLETAAKAEDLYTGNLFRARRRWAEAATKLEGGAWAILSAKHGLTSPSELLEPYDVSLSGANKRTREAWAAKVASSIVAAYGRPERVLLHAGAAYAEALSAELHYKGIEVEWVSEGRQVGEQLAQLRALAEDLEETLEREAERDASSWAAEREEVEARRRDCSGDLEACLCDACVATRAEEGPAFVEVDGRAQDEREELTRRAEEFSLAEAIAAQVEAEEDPRDKLESRIMELVDELARMDSWVGQEEKLAELAIATADFDEEAAEIRDRAERLYFAELLGRRAIEIRELELVPRTSAGEVADWRRDWPRYRRWARKAAPRSVGRKRRLSALAERIEASRGKWAARAESLGAGS